MFSQKDIDKIKSWLIDNVVKEIAKETAKLSKKREQELLEAQKAGSQYTSSYYVSGLDRANIRIKANRGVIRGTQTIEIRSTMRRHPKTGKLHPVKAHDRKYIDKKMFRKSDGTIVVLDHVPDSTTIGIITDSFYEALTERAEFFQGTNQRV